MWTDESGNIDGEVDELVVFLDIDVSDAGTYTGVLTNEFGCVSTVTFDVVVHSNPIASASNDGPILCGAASVTLTALPVGMTYAWSSGGTQQTETVTAVGIYTVTVTDGNGCSSTATTEVTETDPITSMAGPDISFCEGMTGTLMATSMDGPAPIVYAWTGPGGFTSSDMNPIVSVEGIYTLVATDGNGCTSSDDVLVYVFDCDQQTNCYFLDAFNQMGYFNSDGTLSWSAYGWNETGDNNNGNSGDVMFYDNQLLMENDDATPPSIQRRINLAGHMSAVFSFDFSGMGSLDSDDVFSIEVFDGTNWTTIFTFAGPFSNAQMPHLDISAYISANTEIRFNILSGFSDFGESLLLDNIRIDVDCLCEGIAEAGIDIEICEGDTTQLVATGGVSYQWSPVGSVSNALIANPLAFPTTTTTYTVTVTDDFGCEDEDQITVTVNESVDAAAIVLEHDQCEDGNGEVTVTVTNGTGPFTINWSNTAGGETGSATLNAIGDYLISGLNGGTTYCIDVIDNNGCGIQTP